MYNRFLQPRKMSFKALFVGVSLVLPSVAAHSGDDTAGSWWGAWSFDLDLMLPVFVAIYIYTRGLLWRRGRSTLVVNGLEPVFFMLGLLVLVLALQSPIDPLGERSYAMHQVQHLLLRTLAPMLLLLYSPQAILAAGLHSPLRPVLAKMSRVNVVRAFFGILVHPVSVTVLFVISGYVWQYPTYFETALLNDNLHYLMHVTMLSAGLLFWWRIFDDRPSSIPHSKRIVMLLIATIANIVLGAYLTLKEGVLYPVYDDLGRLWLSAEQDEALGGVIMWVPGSKMALVALLVVLYRWGQREERSRRKAVRVQARAPGYNSAVPTTADSARLGMMLGLTSGGIFLGFLVFIAIHLMR